ncbi:MAG TPA: class I SAM-dependent methyltransferase [Bacteroidaceae bacterium]|nr:class I SAM-dependent methyltransferase [Bacteroidaceae bacterium]
MSSLIMPVLDPKHDPMGTAIADYYHTGEAERLIVRSESFDDDEIPVKYLFRSYKQMPRLERLALDKAKGQVLDVGAGSGCHALHLQQKGHDVTAIDVSALSVEVMKERGVEKVLQVNFFEPAFTGKYDTILMLMNGIGIVGTVERLPLFFERVKQLLAPEGVLYLDSSDLKYLFEEEDGSFLIDIAGAYYGEVDFQMVYKDIEGDQFDWLYLDFETLQYYCAQHGFEAKLVAEDNHFGYLASLTYKVEK